MKEMKAKGQDIFQSMTSAMIQTVFEELDIVRYSLNPQCDRKAGIYENAVGGWNSGNLLIIATIVNPLCIRKF